VKLKGLRVACAAAINRNKGIGRQAPIKSEGIARVRVVYHGTNNDIAFYTIHKASRLVTLHYLQGNCWCMVVFNYANFLRKIAAERCVNGVTQADKEAFFTFNKIILENINRNACTSINKFQTAIRGVVIISIGWAAHSIIYSSRIFRRLAIERQFHSNAASFASNLPWGQAN